jgi:hypothetical protein
MAQRLDFTVAAPLAKLWERVTAPLRAAVDGDEFFDWLARHGR